MSKFIIEISDVPFKRENDSDTELFKAKGFRSLVFNREGLEKLTPYEEAKKTITFADVKQGDIVKVGDTEWNVLDTDYDTGIEGKKGVLCMMKDILEERAFDDKNCNNWETSTLREYLNTVYLEELEEEVGKSIKDIALKFERHLDTDDGSKGYGVVEDSISIISTDEYRKYRRYISPKDDYFLTLTPYSSTSGNSYYVRRVGTDGSLNDYYAYHGNRGVSPACVFLTSLDCEITGYYKEEW